MVYLYAIIGLGNPGREYMNTRHNIGFDTVELISSKYNIKLNKGKFKSIYGEGNIDDKKILLVKPQTYMNNSGMAVLDLYNFYKMPIENIIVIVDDVDIDFGAVRVRAKGSGGTHNGLKSIVYQLQRDDFPRIKVGIGKAKEDMDLADFVLSRFSQEDRTIIEEAIKKAARAAELIVKYDVNKAMNEINMKKDIKAQD
ncbi:aminoacyl-tRNA hydrolase [Acidilutibacter cellobiosedens]|uniref:Peptidyl-tRNA hydrolase n=1 Tax=Acidilutibacter cellobiosedens TaxID=2507161 RepID=A0A410QFR5_9FIRM|nr:aminoacyl-tRNA hydrolase [Tissierellaceae bacterium]QAT62769.1 aminoacyl-tRNA hydrolase [Acidilutibacter cellobiosedens]